MALAKTLERVWYEWTSLPVAFAPKSHFAASLKLMTPYLALGGEVRGKNGRCGLSPRHQKAAYRAGQQEMKHKVYYQPH